MKKSNLFSAVILFIACQLSIINCSAQYTKLVDFAGPNGKNPNLSDLIQASDGMLYGVTWGGGANGFGLLFQYNPVTSVFTNKVDFTGGTNGASPRGSLVQANDGMLYGMTNQGGANGFGLLFQYNPAASAYTKKLDFDGATNGEGPLGSLVQASDGMLYGMTSMGGANNFGVIFQYNPATTTYTKKLDFAGTANGENPYGSLMQANDGMLYGMTRAGGANNYGVLFQYDPATSNYTKKLDFAGQTNGQYPMGSLIQASDGMLYGMTHDGGANWYGVIFQYNPATNTYTDKFDFDGTTSSGNSPSGSLMQASDGMIYGLTSKGGTNNAGVLFQYDPTTSSYADKFDFVGTPNGWAPNGALVQASDGVLYGLTSYGGTSTFCTYGCGTLFKYNALALRISQLSSLNSPISVFPNPSNGKTNIQLGDIKNLSGVIRMFDLSGRIVFSVKENNLSAKQNITLDLEPAGISTGIYFLDVVGSNEKIKIAFISN